MYGLVNNALQTMVSDQYGKDAWERIVARVPGCPPEFVSMESYTDDVTYGLVGAACEELGVEAGSFLHELGEYWIPYASRAGYAALLERGGRSLPEFLQGLDAMHSRLALSYSKLQPPSFRVFDIGDTSLRLHYYSKRQGLQPLRLVKHDRAGISLGPPHVGQFFRSLSNLPSLLDLSAGVCSQTLALIYHAYDSTTQPARTFGHPAGGSPISGKSEE